MDWTLWFQIVLFFLTAAVVIGGAAVEIIKAWRKQ